MVKSKWAYALVGVLAVGTLSMSIARAGDPVCGTLAECQSLKAQVEARIAELTPAPVLGPIVRNTDGSVRRMTQSEAVSYCATRGGLPTAKQLALALNARGVSDTAREGFYRVAPKNETPFYYNYGAYERPTGDEGSEWFWSSSLRPNYDVSAFAFFGYGGYIDDYYRGSNVAVRCGGR